MKLKIEICMDNAAFEGDAGYEAADIIRAAAKAVQQGCIRSSLFDSNGNVVGKFTIVGRRRS